jgi:hypothetical protein
MTRPEFTRLIALSYSTPRVGAQAVIGLALPVPVVIQMLALMAILLTLIGVLEQTLATTDTVPQIAGGNLFIVVVIHTVLLLVPSALILSLIHI